MVEVTNTQADLQMKTLRDVEEVPPSLNCLQYEAEIGVAAPMSQPQCRQGGKGDPPSDKEATAQINLSWLAK